MNDTFIPPATREKLDTVYPVGTRHKVALDLAISLLGNGISSQAVFAQLRSKFESDVSDKELQDIVCWAEGKHPAPSGYGERKSTRQQIFHPPEKKRTPLEHCQWWLSGLTMTAEAFAQMSQLPIPDAPKAALALFLEMTYLGTDNLNVVCAFIEEGSKAKPHGPGRIISRDRWVEYLQTKGIPESKAGAWFRPNPCAAQGSGSAGAVTDSDITAWRFLLLESDVLPLEVQFALFSKLKLPFAWVVGSGGISIHAMVRIDAADAQTFSETARRILTALAPFGIDQANKNPSRLSRLPSAQRKIGAAADGVQRLLWLNPGKPAVKEAELSAFEDSLLFPAIEEKPFKAVIKEAITRYEELAEQKKSNVIPTGLADFDSDSGGLFPSQMTLITAETGSGKSSLLANILNSALAAGNGVVLFTLEMERSEIADMLFALNCDVDRNHFNTGKFANGDVERMTSKVKYLGDLPLWVFDESSLTPSEIRRRVLHLVSEGRVKLAAVDYAQIVMPENFHDGREQQVAFIGQALRALAKDAKIPLIVLSQLNDEGKVRESRVLAHVSHNVFLLENQEEKGRMILKVVKGRRIRKKHYDLFYNPAFCKITSLSKITDQDVPETRNAYAD